MTDKPDYYQVLGVPKTASADDIKRAYNKCCLSCHPDRVKNKTAKEKEDANKKYVAVTEAYEVLKDAKKKAIYDQKGHQGLEDLKEGNPSTNVKPINYTRNPQSTSAEDAFAFLEKSKERINGESSTTDGTLRVSAAERARLAAIEREKNRQALKDKNKAGNPSPVKTDFDDVTKKASETAEEIKGADLSEMSLSEIEKLERHLDEASKIVKAAKQRKLKGPGG